MPTGVAIRDVRERLFDAAERVLLRDGPSELTSRAVTSEAGCAKGVLHRHFTDFDTFLVELVLDRIRGLDAQGRALRDSAGTGAVVDNLTTALGTVFESVAVEILGLVTSRHELLARLRRTTPTGIPVLAEVTAMLASYLAIERELGRVAAVADVDALAPMLVGTGHLLFAGQRDAPPTPEAVRKVVAAALAGIV
ncbi:MAG TPA: TetR/AcrR family transcriptional regulator [Solirubrobacteraceae bacterium]|nr:TetR/AcrR family transcriptional regulator [Solirubrobacteraceae bacterium]